MLKWNHLKDLKLLYNKKFKKEQDDKLKSLNNQEIKQHNEIILKLPENAV